MKIEIKESTEVKKPNYPYLAKAPDDRLVFVSVNGYQYVNKLDMKFTFNGGAWEERHLTPLPSGSQVILTQE